jgi:hypothetical protein
VVEPSISRFAAVEALILANKASETIARDLR